ncbi:methyltransferase domain-containing protein [Martelella lutilitoris]|uniref:Methyltransferase domain-containing protein n=1 Tax=Martelella lutilitoris TaxID=2583532 RepID=A0A5C4JW14_9HYPH|nr:methyltransferase domain-containing protein [Martelella lutilitoris]TNB49658.1 methyltransferase domain-containing protein [Martelella lutilitoris]
MSFDADWLTLREPADKAARDERLVEAFARHLSGAAKPLVIDIGCGTGSTLRCLAHAVPADKNWLLLDNDPLLLKEAERRSEAHAGIALRRHDLNDLVGLPLEDAAIVTASALFDLCSEDFSARFAERLAVCSVGLYAALNYDGRIDWSEAHPLDETVVAAFNRHQQTDKGFGVALGPKAAARLAVLFGDHGFRVETGESPWRLSSDSAPLQKAFIEGFRQPLQEIGGLRSSDIDDWIAFRLAAAEKPGSHCTVGHTDLLALPV